MSRTGIPSIPRGRGAGVAPLRVPNLKQYSCLVYKWTCTKCGGAGFIVQPTTGPGSEIPLLERLKMSHTRKGQELGHCAWDEDAVRLVRASSTGRTPTVPPLQNIPIHNRQQHQRR